MNDRSRPKAAPESPAQATTSTVSDPALFGVSDDGRAVLPVETAEMARDRGLALVEDASGDWSRRVVDQAIRAAAQTLQTFSANDVRELLPAERSGLIGARFLAAAKRGEIVRIGYVPASHAAGHGRPIALWTAAPTTTAGA